MIYFFFVRLSSLCDPDLEKNIILMLFFTLIFAHKAVWCRLSNATKFKILAHILLLWGTQQENIWKFSLFFMISQSNYHIHDFPCIFRNSLNYAMIALIPWKCAHATQLQNDREC